MKNPFSRPSNAAGGGQATGEKLRRTDPFIDEVQRLDPPGFWQWNLRTNAVTGSDGLCRLFGVTQPKATPRFEDFTERVHPRDRTLLAEVTEQALRDHQPFSFRVQVVGADGTEHVVQWCGCVEVDEAGRPVQIFGTAQEEGERRGEARRAELEQANEALQAVIAERKRTEQALRESESRARQLVDALPAALYACDAQGFITQYNPAAVTLWGREPELGKDLWCGSWRLYYPDGSPLPFEDCPMGVALREGRSVRGQEIVVERPDGTRAYVLPYPDPIRDASGAVVGAVNMLVDLTERRRVEEALRESEERYRRISESGFINICFFTTDGRVTDANDAWLRLMGVNRQELAAGLVRWDELTAPEWLARTRQAIEEFKATGRISPYEKEYVRRDGSRFWALVGGAKLEGRAEGVAFVLDITERKQAEEALREREAQLAFAQCVGRVGVWGRDLVTRTSFVTEEWCEIVGVKNPALVRSAPEFLALVHPDDRARVEAANRRTIQTGSDMDLELRIQHPERGERWILTRGRCLASADGKGHRLLGVIIDITAQKRAEEAWRASEERLRFAAQAAGFGSYDLDLVSGQGYRSPEYKALFGLGPDEEFPLDADALPVCVHPDDRALVRKGLRDSRDPRGSGTKDLEYRIILPDGPVRWLLVRGRTFFEGQGKSRRPIRSRGIALDVTGRKQLEQEILEISGREQRRIGHDLHDDLCQRLGGLQLLSGVLEKELAAEGYPQSQQAGRILEQVREALERARLLARGLAPVAVEEGGLATALEELADNAAQLFHIRCEFRAERPVGLADAGAATHLYRIAQEAITNAVKHGHAKQVVIGLTDAGDSFELKVSDDGRGFARTKAAKPGMGLRIMKYRAAMLGAILDVRSAPGRGTRVTCAFGKHLCSAPRSTKQRVGG